MISGNTITNSNVGGCGVVVAAYDPGEGVSNNIVTGNHVVNGYAGIVVAADVPNTSAVNNTVVANTVLDNQLPGIIIHSNTPGDVVSGTVIMRNIVSGTPARPEPTGVTLIGVVNPGPHLHLWGTSCTTNISELKWRMPRARESSKTSLIPPFQFLYRAFRQLLHQ